VSETISLRTQLDHYAWMSNCIDRAEPELKKKGLANDREAPTRVRYTGAIRTTLTWLQKHEDRIRRYLRHAEEIDRLLAMEPEVRAAIMDHGPAVAALAVEAAAREVLGASMEERT